MATENQDLESQMKSIFKQDYHQAIPHWIKNASKTDKKGLKLTVKIIKNQGLKRFRPSKQVNPTVSSKSIFKSQSQYNEAYGENIIQKVFESEVLKFVSLSSMKVSQILIPEVLMFIERWLKLNDEEIYQNFVLSFIKGFYSVIKVNVSALTSTNRETFSRKKAERIPVFGRKKWIDEEYRVKLPEIKKFKSLEVVGTRSNLDDVKKIVCRENKDMLKWVTGNNQFKTMYQDQFHSRSVASLVPTKKNFYTSTSIKLLPDLAS